MKKYVSHKIFKISKNSLDSNKVNFQKNEKFSNISKSYWIYFKTISDIPTRFVYRENKFPLYAFNNIITIEERVMRRTQMLITTITLQYIDIVKVLS